MRALRKFRDGPFLAERVRLSSSIPALQQQLTETCLLFLSDFDVVISHRRFAD